MPMRYCEFEIRYKQLALAIVQQAAHDYIKSFDIRENYSEATNERNCSLRNDSEWFLQSKWCDYLLAEGGINHTGKELLDKLRQEV